MFRVCVLSYSLLFVCVCRYEGATFRESTELYRKLLNRTARHIRPLIDQSQCLRVEIELILRSLNVFDEVSGILTTVSVLDMAWRDENIRWESLEFNGTSHMYLPTDLVWTPKLILTNTAERIREIDDVSEYVRYDQNGSSVWHFGNIFTTTCTADLTYYPYDTQRCELTFVSSAYSASEVLLLSGEKGFDASYLEENGFWNTIKTSSEHYVIDNKSFVSFIITFKRNPMFFVINILLPIQFLCVLNLLVFLLPAESGERASYAMTVLLSLAVFMTIVSDNLPKVSKPVPLITYYLLSLVTSSACIASINIAVLRIYHCNESESVPWYKLPLIWISKKNCVAKKSRIGKVTSMHPLTQIPGPCDMEQKIPGLCDMEQKIPGPCDMEQTQSDTDGELSKNAARTDVRDEIVQRKQSWNKIGKSLDQICLLIFALILVTEIVVFQFHLQSQY